MEEYEEYKETGYYEDAFSTSPDNRSPLIGYDRILNDVAYWVKSGNIIFIEGEDGFGKTSILLNIAHRFKGQRKVVYLDCLRLKNGLNIEKLLINKHGMIGRIFKVLPKEMIVLLDNVQVLSKRNAERVKFFFDNNYIKSVVLTAESMDKVNLSESLIHRIGKNRITLPRLSKNRAGEILFSRIDEASLMDDLTLKKLFVNSSYNPKRFLMNCIKVYEYADDNEKDRIYIPDLEKVIKNGKPDMV